MNLVRPLSLCAGLLGLALIGIVTHLHAQSPRNVNWQPMVTAPLYPPGKGPLVAVDEAHFNFHTIEGRYRGFAQALESDGYVVHPGKTPFTPAALRRIRILVIANALSERNRDPANWSPPISSAFTAGEIQAVREWVHNGGSLLLIVDHLPFAGASKQLAAAFGFELIDGYAVPPRRPQPPPPSHRQVPSRPRPAVLLPG